MSSQIGDGLLYNQVKAGLTGSAHEIATKIAEVSRDTKYYQFQKQRSKNVDKKLEEYKSRLRTASIAELDFAKKSADAYISTLEKKIDFNPVYMHADLDSFFASVESLDDPSLVGIPFAVGGSVKHGVISTSSYEARKYGVRSGMAVFIALQLCPELRLVPHHGNRYVELSQQVQSVFAKYDPDFVSFGLDEATLDVTKHIREGCEDPTELALKIQREVFEKTKLTISIGVGHTQQLAKISSDINKPNGVFVCPFEREGLRTFLKTLPIRKVPGIGGVSEQIMKGLGIELLGDVIERRTDIWFLFSQAFCQFVIPSAVGVHVDRFKDKDNQKSISKERTFDATSDRSFLFEVIEMLAVKVWRRMVRMRVASKTITVKFKDASFNVTSRSHTFDTDTCSLDDIVRASLKLVSEDIAERGLKMRLLGVRASNLRLPGEKRQKSIRSWVVRGQQTPPSSPPRAQPEPKVAKKPRTDLRDLFQKMRENDSEEPPCGQSRGPKIELDVAPKTVKKFKLKPKKAPKQNKTIRGAIIEWMR